MSSKLTWDDIERERHRYEGRGPSLAKLAEFINEHFPQYNADMPKCSYRPERKLYARISSFGKRREGKCLEVREKAAPYKTVYRHNPLEPYRRNSDVAHWISQHRSEAQQ